MVGTFFFFFLEAGGDKGVNRKIVSDSFSRRGFSLLYRTKDKGSYLAAHRRTVSWFKDFETRDENLRKGGEKRKFVEKINNGLLCIER